MHYLEMSREYWLFTVKSHSAFSPFMFSEWQDMLNMGGEL